MTQEEFTEKYTNIEFGRIIVDRLCVVNSGHKTLPYDEREVAALNEYRIYLPHSCDEWVIGDINEAKEFSEDLLKAIACVERMLNENS